MTEPTPPEWPSRVDAVEIAKLDLKPGSKLIIKPKEGAAFDVDVSRELHEFFQYMLPDVLVIVIGLPVDLEVARPGEDGG